MSTGEVNTDLLNRLGLNSRPRADERDAGQVGQEQFLELMLTQLKNQDPLQPMESGQFLTQIAQFTMASGVSDLNKSFENVSESVRSSQVLQASNLIGRTVLVETASVDGKAPAMLEGGMLGGAVELPQPTSNLGITIHDKYGQPVRTLNLGERPAGMNYFTWDGMDDEGNPMPEGEYQISATARFGGEAEALETLSMDQVISVSIGASGADYTVNLSGTGDTKVSQIRQIL